MIDHVFLFIEPDGPEIARLTAMGLVETYRRRHPGQGTANVCFCFDNMFLELLWIEDAAEARSSRIVRTGLYERSLWRQTDACPFGIAWRRTLPGPVIDVATWAFSPPYLPEGMSIAVATDSDDPRQPMMFESPGSTAPAEWPPEKRGALQHGAGLTTILDITLTLPTTTPPSAALNTIARHGSPSLTLCPGESYGMRLRVAAPGRAEDMIIDFS
ncbi:VOC family protein [Ciceribacter sp. L1K23]|uniref:VOC family protein n=1 Tax=Ciceribacter sp. L1K23 TaxID=2820276 RepID=UPI001B8139D1|nr:VOC family protein [Ciceribacter sp. L1K23]MBR0555784.1 VOC family protein [Ciceribacter sp. L1K23]